MDQQTYRQKFHNRKGFTLTELLVVITIIAVLASIGFFGTSRVRDSARRAASLGNLRQMGVGITTFVADNNGFLPLSRNASKYWPEVIHPFVSSDVFLRPGSKNVPASATRPEGYFDGVSAKTAEGVPIRWNYIINGGHAALPFSEDPKNNTNFARGYSRSFSSIEVPNRTVFMAEGKENNWWFNSEAKSNSNRIYRWKDGSSNVLFADGSTQNLNPKSELKNADFLVLKPSV